MYRRNELVVVQRDCGATGIPGGEKLRLSKGDSVTVVQTLGGSYTVVTDDGYMLRIDGKDGDALGEKYVLAQPEIKPADPDGVFDESAVWDQLKTVYDPEIPVNIVDLGLVYKCQPVALPEGGYKLDIEMTMTAPGCGMGGVLKEDVRHKVMAIPGVREANVEVVWDPPWDQSRMSDAARLQLGWM
jgi:probable FeS assembly SUF system protein SufT